MESNPVCHPSPAKKIKCLFLDYVQLLMIGRTGQWAWTLSATLLQWKIKNAHFWITFNFWWSAGLVDGLEDHLPPLSSQKKNAHFWIMFNFWWLARLVDGLEPHPPLLSSLKNKMLVFGLCSTSDDQPGWSMDSNPICHPSPAKEIKCLFLDYIQPLMIDQAGPPPLSSQKNKMLIFGLCSTSDDWPGWSMDLNPIHHSSPAWKNKMLVFGLCSTSDDQPCWSMDSNTIWHPSPA